MLPTTPAAQDGSARPVLRIVLETKVTAPLSIKRVAMELSVDFKKITVQDTTCQLPAWAKVRS